jgi:hypothetical protein
MSQENVDVVRCLYALWDAADFDPMVELLDVGAPRARPWRSKRVGCRV